MDVVVDGESLGPQPAPPRKLGCLGAHDVSRPELRRKKAIWSLEIEIADTYRLHACPSPLEHIKAKSEDGSINCPRSRGFFVVYQWRSLTLGKQV
jgi:hypothetical protein